MNYKVEHLPLSRLALNTGQIEGLPANPRQWTREDIDNIAASLTDTPELFELRPIIAVKHGEEAVILAGSLRFCGAQANGAETAPVILLGEDLPVEKMKEIVIKDNGSFGAWDADSLANEWDDLPLAKWGVPSWLANPEPEVDDSLDGLFEDAGEQGDKGEKITIEVPTDYEDSIEDIKAAIKVTLEEWKGCKVK